MIYMKQLPDYSRIVVKEDVYLVDKFNPDFIWIIRTDSVSIYRINGAIQSPPPKEKLFYGGRRQRGLDRI